MANEFLRVQASVELHTNTHATLWSETTDPHITLYRNGNVLKKTEKRITKNIKAHHVNIQSGF